MRQRARRFFVLTSDKCHFTLTTVIRHIRHKGLRAFWEGKSRRGVPAEFVERIDRILDRLDVASTPENMNIPGFALHPLKGKLSGYWSVTVRANWRIIFRFADTDATDIDLLDYH